jgi:hypothetical protein
MSKSKRKKPVVFTAKRRKDLVADLGKKDYADIVEAAITRMESGLHLDLFPPRKKFVTIVCSEKVKPVLTQFIMENVRRRCMVGKGGLATLNSALLNQPLKLVITLRLACGTMLWKRAKLSGGDLPVSDQRIIVSTLAYHIHDLMVDRVKAYKETGFLN